MRIDYFVSPLNGSLHSYPISKHAGIFGNIIQICVTRTPLVWVTALSSSGPPADPPGLAVFLRDLDSDRRPKTRETELLWYYVASPNPWLPVA